MNNKALSIGFLFLVFILKLEASELKQELIGENNVAISGNTGNVTIAKFFQKDNKYEALEGTIARETLLKFVSNMAKREIEKSPENFNLESWTNKYKKSIDSTIYIFYAARKLDDEIRRKNADNNSSSITVNYTWELLESLRNGKLDDVLSVTKKIISEGEVNACFFKDEIKNLARLTGDNEKSFYEKMEKDCLQQPHLSPTIGAAGLAPSLTSIMTTISAVAVPALLRAVTYSDDDPASP